MTTIYIKDRTELFTRVKDALHSFKNFDVCYKGKSVKVTTDEKGLVNLDPHNERCLYDSKFIDDFVKDIVSDIKGTLFKRENLVLLTTVSRSGSTQKWFLDKRTQRVFYVEDGKVFIDAAKKDSLYSYILQEGKDKLTIENVIVDENYQLCPYDLETIKDTDVDKEYFRGCLIQKFKGKPYRKAMARFTLCEVQYSYKVFFNCDECGKESFFWMKHIPGAFIDHRGPDFCCEECEIKYYEEHKKEIAEQNRQWEESSKSLNLNVIKINPPSTIRTEVFDEKHMALPTDKIYYIEPMLIRTRN